jgi:hypothetical protein
MLRSLVGAFQLVILIACAEYREASVHAVYFRKEILPFDNATITTPFS